MFFLFSINKHDTELFENSENNCSFELSLRLKIHKNVTKKLKGLHVLNKV